MLVTDPQPETGAEVDFIREDLIQALAGVDAKFGLTAGDVMFDDLSLYPRSNAIMGTIGLPWWNIGGNHDLNFEAPDRKYSRETFKRVFGPNYYAFFYAQTLFLMLDDVNYLGPDPHKVGGGGKYEGRLDEGQLEFVRNVLAHTPDDTLDRHGDAHSRSTRFSTTSPIRTCRIATRSSPCSKDAATRSASPVTRIRPSIIISMAPRAGKALLPTITMY